MDLTLSRATLRPYLFGLMALVVASGVGVELAQARWGLRAREGAVPLLSLSYEWNLPTAYSAALLLGCALLLAVAARASRLAGERSAPWWVLTGGFVLMSLDELIGLHEKADGLAGLHHLFYFDWVVPAAGLVLVLGLGFIPFLRRLPRVTRVRFVVAGAIYVGSAVGMDVPLGWWTARHGEHGLGYALIDAVEEAGEMLGLNLFLLALVDHLALGRCALRFGPPPPDPAPADEAT